MKDGYTKLLPVVSFGVAVAALTYGPQDLTFGPPPAVHAASTARHLAPAGVASGTLVTGRPEKTGLLLVLRTENGGLTQLSLRRGTAAVGRDGHSIDLRNMRAGDRLRVQGNGRITDLSRQTVDLRAWCTRKSSEGVRV